MEFQKIIALLTLLLCSTTYSLAAKNSPDSIILKSSNLFSIDLLTQIANDMCKTNLIISPLIAQLGLTMLSYGARGETANQLGSVLRLPIDRQTILNGYRILLTKIRSTKSVELKIANKLFLAKEASLKIKFYDLIRFYFLTDISQLEANTREAVKQVNRWVNATTNGTIDRLLDDGDIDDSTRLIVLSAVYFKARWNFTIDPNNNSNRTFYLADGTKKSVVMMYTKGNFVSGEIRDLDAKYIELPYRDTGLRLIIAVPNKITGLTELEKKMRLLRYRNIKNYVEINEIEIYLPRFKIESINDLTDALLKMGATNMFGDKADFSGISSELLRVNKVIQKAFINVNEEGSEASAASSAVLSSRFGSETIEVNRPFYFAIRSSKSVLFEGHVTDPSA